MRSLVLPFLCVGADGVSLDELAGVDEEAWRPAVRRLVMTWYPLIIY